MAQKPTRNISCSKCLQLQILVIESDDFTITSDNIKIPGFRPIFEWLAATKPNWALPVIRLSLNLQRLFVSKLNSKSGKMTEKALSISKQRQKRNLQDGQICSPTKAKKIGLKIKQKRLYCSTKFFLNFFLLYYKL